eukprot:g524.t1
MSSKARKRQIASSSESEDNPEEMEISDKDPSEKEIEAEFQFFDPVEADSEPIKELLTNQLRGIDVDIPTLANSIIQQKTVGTVLKCGEGEDAYLCGFISVFNMHQNREVKWIQQVKAFIIQRCQDSQKKETFQDAMDSVRTGLMVNERLLNCPPQVGPPLNQALFEEISWAQEDEPTQELRDSFKFEQYILITKAFQDPTQEADLDHSSKKSKIKGPSGYIYSKPEDEFYHKFSKEWFSFPLIQEQEDALHPYRLIMLLTHDSANQASSVLSNRVLMESILKEKFRELHDTQATVVSTANFLIENSAESKAIVKAWNQEFIKARPEKKLTLLYLANDVLQRCKTSDFLSEFIHFLPKATAHLYKHGNEELRSNLDRLVEVWDQRKVLRTRGIAAVRTQLAKVKSTVMELAVENPHSSKEDRSVGSSPHGSKRKRPINGGGTHPITEGFDEVQEAVNRTKQSENELKQFLGSRELGELNDEQLRSIQELNGKHYEAVKQEVNLRKKVVDLLREKLAEQEECQKNAKEMHRLCIARKGEIQSLLGTSDQKPAQSLHEETPVLGNALNSYSGRPMPLGYPLGMIPEGADLHFGLTEHPSFASHSLLQPVPAGSFFPVLHSDTVEVNPQDQRINNVYNLSRPFLPPDYMQSNQSHQLPQYQSHSIQDVHGSGSSYLHPIKFDEFPEAYDPEKEWNM